jgi:exodeoxyribonuclease III
MTRTGGWKGGPRRCAGRPSDSPASSVWDYFRQRWERNRGLRIDFVLASTALAARVKGASIDTEERAGKGASDHAPVIIELE